MKDSDSTKGCSWTDSQGHTWTKHCKENPTCNLCDVFKVSRMEMNNCRNTFSGKLYPASSFRFIKIEIQRSYRRKLMACRDFKINVRLGLTNPDEN